MAEVFTVTSTVSIHFSPAHTHYCQRCSGRTGEHAQISFSLACVAINHKPSQKERDARTAA